MVNVLMEKEDKDLKNIGLELMFCTPEKCENSEGYTAVELARKLNIKIDIVKKKLRILQQKDIVQPKGINPKIWKFDDFHFQRMDEDDPVYNLLCCFEDVDFDKYFEY